MTYEKSSAIPKDISVLFYFLLLYLAYKFLFY